MDYVRVVEIGETLEHLGRVRRDESLIELAKRFKGLSQGTVLDVSVWKEGGGLVTALMHARTHEAK